MVAGEPPDLHQVQLAREHAPDLAHGQQLLLRVVLGAVLRRVLPDARHHRPARVLRDAHGLHGVVLAAAAHGAAHVVAHKVIHERHGREAVPARQRRLAQRLVARHEHVQRPLEPLEAGFLDRPAADPALLAVAGGADLHGVRRPRFARAPLVGPRAALVAHALPLAVHGFFRPLAQRQLNMSALLCVFFI
eukprot:897181-Rhodomonas_salina.1